MGCGALRSEWRENKIPETFLILQFPHVLLIRKQPLPSQISYRKTSAINIKCLFCLSWPGFPHFTLHSPSLSGGECV